MNGVKGGCVPRYESRWWVVFICCVVLVGPTRAIAELRSFTSVDGKMTQAELVSVRGDQVTLKLASGKEVALPLERFSEADQQFIRHWHEENKHKVPEHLKDKRPRIDMHFNAGRSVSRGPNGLVRFRPSVVIESRDAVYPVHDAKLNIIITGKSARTEENVIVYKYVFEDIHLPLSKELRFEGRPFALWSESGNGFKFKDYFVWLEDPDGKVLVELHAPPSAAKYIKNVQTLEPGDVYNRDYEKVGTENLGSAVKM